MRRLGKTVLLAGAILAAGCLTMACALVASGTVASPWAGRSVATSPGPPGHPATSPRPSAAPVLAAAAQPSDTPSAPTPTALPTTPTALPTTPTAVPTTPTPAATSASPTASPTSTSSGNLFSGDLIWLWVILGALVLLGIILLATRSPGRSGGGGGTPVASRPPPMPTSGWHAKVTEAYSEGAALDQSVRAVARQDAFTDAALNSDLQRRIYHLTETLYGMRDTAPTETRRAQVVNSLLALEAVTDVINARRTPGGANTPQGMGLNARLAALESALNDLRVPEQPVL
jgi:hypothetical protein